MSTAKSRDNAASGTTSEATRSGTPEPEAVAPDAAESPAESSGGDGEVVNSRQRTLTGWVKWIVYGLMLVYALYFLYAAGAHPLPGIQHRAIHLAGGFVFILVLYAPAKRLVHSKIALAVDILLTIPVIAGNIYVFEIFDTYADRVGLPATTPDVLFGLVIFVVMFEVARRVTGWAFPIVAAGFVYFALYGFVFPAPFTHRGFDIPQFMATFFYTLNGPYGQITHISASYILIFIIFAAFVAQSGAGEFIRDMAMVALGKVRGGPAKIAVVASSFMGMLTGSSLANVASIGSITIPMMKRTGYRAEFAGGVEATSGMGAQIMPPIMGGSIFIMMELLGVSYWYIAGSAFLVGGLYYLALFFMVDLEAARKDLRGLPREQLPKFWPVLKRGWFHLIPISLVVYMLAVEGVSPGRAAFWGIIAIIAIMLVTERSRKTPVRIADGMVNGIRSSLIVVSIVALASLIAGIVTVTGLGVNLSTILIDLSQGSLPLLLVIAALASLLMGMGVPILVAYSVLAILVAPALIEMGVTPLAAHMFIFYFGVISAITPPVAPDAFVAAGIARSSPFRTANQAVRIAGALYLLPFLFVYDNALLLQGTVGEILLAGGTAALGIYGLACAWQATILMNIQVGTWARLVLGAAAIALIIPQWTSSVAGLVVLVLVHAFYHLRVGRRSGTDRVSSTVRGPK